MLKRSDHIHWFLTALLLACCGCPSVNTPTGTSDSNTSAVPIETALAQSTDTTVLSSKPTPACAVAGLPASNIHRAMFEQLNTYRAQNGLPTLVYSKTLEAAANAHVKDLYDRNFFEHVNPDGKSPADRALTAGFCHKYVGENIAAGQTSVTGVMTAWKNSPHHNENMLEADYVYVGMGYYVDPNGRQYWGQEFAFDVPNLQQ